MTIETSRDLMTSVQDILASDAGPRPPEPFRETSNRSFGLADIPIDRYLSAEYCRLEHEQLWSRVWQWACMEEDIPNVGDHTIYEIGDRSVLIVRSEPDRIQAFPNACLHRGRRLKDCPGNARVLTCGFHGWSYNLDGSLRKIPCQWDFPHVEDQAFTLPEIKLDRWSGFVFVNFDENCGPLSEMLDIIPEHFKHFPLDNKFTAANVQKVVPANWKVAVEAFLESYHVIRTHPDVLGFVSDANTQYDVWETTSRLYTLFGLASPHLGSVDNDKIWASGMRYYLQGGDPPPLPEGETPRHAMADFLREMIHNMLGVELAEVSDALMIDAVEYFMFPNWMPWPGVVNGIQYRFRPNGYDPDSSIFDVRLLFPVPPGGERPPAAPLRVLGPDEPFASAGELLGVGAIFDQDYSNLEAVQRGLKATARSGVTLSQYHESRIRHFHKLLDKWMST